MARVAQSEVWYCGGLSTAALSINGTLFQTNNPPIRYTVSGFTATVEDNAGVIGTATLPSKQVLAATVENPDQNTWYFGGFDRAILRYTVDGSEKTFETTSLDPNGIRYFYEAEDPGGYWICRHATNSSCGFNVGEAVAGRKSEGVYTEVDYGQRFPNNHRLWYSRRAGGAIFFNYGITTNAFRCGLVWQANRGNNSIRSRSLFPIPPASAFVYVRDNAGEQEFYYDTTQNVGNFILEGYDTVADESNIFVACEGECPPKTEYQCECDGTLFCYGYDRNVEPNEFRVLYQTPKTL